MVKLNPTDAEMLRKLAEYSSIDPVRKLKCVLSGHLLREPEMSTSDAVKMITECFDQRIRETQSLIEVQRGALKSTDEPDIILEKIRTLTTFIKEYEQNKWGFAVILKKY